MIIIEIPNMARFLLMYIERARIIAFLWHHGLKAPGAEGLVRMGKAEWIFLARRNESVPKIGRFCVSSSFACCSGYNHCTSDYAAEVGMAMD